MYLIYIYIQIYKYTDIPRYIWDSCRWCVMMVDRFWVCLCQHLCRHRHSEADKLKPSIHSWGRSTECPCLSLGGHYSRYLKLNWYPQFFWLHSPNSLGNIVRWWMVMYSYRTEYCGPRETPLHTPLHPSSPLVTFLPAVKRLELFRWIIVSRSNRTTRQALGYPATGDQVINWVVE